MLNGKDIEEFLYQSDDYNELITFLLSSNTSSSSLSSSLSFLFSFIYQDTNRSILMSVSKCNCYNICLSIINNYPFTINIINSKGYNALHYASFYKNKEILKLLCFNYCNILQKNNYKEYTFDTTSIIGRSDLEYILLSKFLYHSQQFQQEEEIEEEEKQQQKELSLFKDYEIDLIENQPIKNIQFIQQQNQDIWLSSSNIFQTNYYNCNERSFYDTHLSYLSEEFNKVDINNYQNTFLSSSLPISSNELNSITNLSNLQNYSLIILENIDGGTEVIGTLFDVFTSLTLQTFTKITIGRSSSNTIILKDMSISKSHLEISFFDGIGLSIIDCGSTHGTFIDDIQLTSIKKSLNKNSNNNNNNNNNNNMINNCMSIINKSTSIIRVGRVKIGFQKKPMSNIVSKQFQPNKEIGQQLYESTRIKYLLESSNIGKQKPIQNQFYLDPLISRNILVMKSIENELNQNNEIDKGNEINEQLKESVGETIESETFIGRNLLVKMGWESGMKLGKSGGIANEPIQVVMKQDKSGIGIKSQQQQPQEEQQRNKKNINKRKNEVDIVHITKMRYYNLNQEY